MDKPRDELSLSEGDRREFLKTCGRFAAVTPPARDNVAFNEPHLRRHRSLGQRLERRQGRWGRE
jgi:hypothetical protein